MNIQQLDDQFKEEAYKRELIAIEKCGHRPGRFQTMAKGGALNAAIKLIKKREPSEGLTRLYLCNDKYPGAYKLSIEQIFIDFYEKYGNDFPDVFDKEVVEAAKRKLPK
jgi:hypothetical protein